MPSGAALRTFGSSSELREVEAAIGDLTVQRNTALAAGADLAQGQGWLTPAGDGTMNYDQRVELREALVMTERNLAKAHRRSDKVRGELAQARRTHRQALLITLLPTRAKACRELAAAFEVMLAAWRRVDETDAALRQAGVTVKQHAIACAIERLTRKLREDIIAGSEPPGRRAA
jgi:hypothetical protein